MQAGEGSTSASYPSTPTHSQAQDLPTNLPMKPSLTPSTMAVKGSPTGSELSSTSFLASSTGLPKGPESDTQSLHGSAVGELSPEGAGPFDPAQMGTKEGSTGLHSKDPLQAGHTEDQEGSMAGLLRHDTGEAAASVQVRPMNSSEPDEQVRNDDDMFSGLTFG